MNLYGVASIRLDKVRGGQIKKMVQILMAVYGLLLFLSFTMPSRLETFDLGSTQVTKLQNNEMTLRFRQVFKLNDDTLDDFEIIMSELKAQEILKSNRTRTYFSDHKLDMKIKWFETDQESVKLLYVQEPEMTEMRIEAIGFKPLPKIESHLNATISKGLLTKTLDKNRLCEFTTDSKFECNDLRIVGSRASERKLYQLLQIDIDPIQMSHTHKADAKQEDLKIESATFKLQIRSQRFEFYFSMIKMVFVVASFITLVSFKHGIRQFHKTDIGIVQRYIEALLVALVLFNDPLCFFFMANRQIMYACYQSVVESFFIALLFFFWLLLMHSIAQSENIISISWKQFYFPKIIVCSALLSYLVSMRIYVYIRYSQDPFFEFLLKVENMDSMYEYLHSFGIIVITLYLVYFCMILSKAIIVI